MTHIPIRRAHVTLFVVTGLAAYFGYHLFVLHHETMAHGFELTAVPIADRLIAALCGAGE